MSVATHERASAPVTQAWVVGPARSSVEFRVRHVWGHATVAGRFTRFHGSYTANPDARLIDLDIAADSLDTGNSIRDKHLRAADFFEVEKHPHVRFTARDVVDSDNGTLKIAGELEAAGRTVPLSFEAESREVGDELELEATTTLDQRLLGMTYSPLGMVRTPSTLHVKARLTPAPA